MNDKFPGEENLLALPSQDGTANTPPLSSFFNAINREDSSASIQFPE
jgi:hypothetical protein